MDIKPIIAKNIAELRQRAGMTQLELAERLNYTDKAVSKWERGESIPDVAVLVEIAGLFQVTLDDLVKEHTTLPTPNQKKHRHNRGFITGMSVLLVWLIATAIFVPLLISLPGAIQIYLPYVWAVPASMIVWLVLNSIWSDRRRNYLIISLMVWSLLAGIHLTVLPAANIWQIYLLGIPGQIIILLWSKVKEK